MTVEKLRRVLWRVRERNPGNAKPTNLELRRGIMLEIGTDPRTYTVNRKALLKLGWIRIYNKSRVQLTGEDIE